MLTWSPGHDLINEQQLGCQEEQHSSQLYQYHFNIIHVYKLWQGKNVYECLDEGEGQLPSNIFENPECKQENVMGMHYRKWKFLCIII